MATPNTAELLALLEPLPLDEKGVGIVHYGERNQAVAAALRGRRASLHELLLYEWRLPEDVAPLRQLVVQILAGEVDAVAFLANCEQYYASQVVLQWDLDVNSSYETTGSPVTFSAAAFDGPSVVTVPVQAHHPSSGVEQGGPCPLGAGARSADGRPSHLLVDIIHTSV